MLRRICFTLLAVGLSFCGPSKDGIRTIPGKSDKLCPACVTN